MSMVPEAHQIRRGFEYGVRHVLASQSGSLVEVLENDIHLGADCISQLIDIGAIYLKGSRCVGPSAEQQSIRSGDYLRIHTLPRRYSIQNLNLKDLIVFGNEDFIVVNKPSGIPVHATVDNVKENLLCLLSEHLEINLEITHRLDVVTEGLMVYAKTKDFKEKFNSYLRSSKVQKIYSAKVDGRNDKQKGPPQLGLWTHYMERSPRAPKTVSRSPREGWQECRLRVLSRQPQECDGSWLLEIELDTGRTHQIRSQLSFEGYPILGDAQYGSQALWHAEKESIALRSRRISFPGDFHFEIPALT